MKRIFALLAIVLVCGLVAFSAMQTVKISQGTMEGEPALTTSGAIHAAAGEVVHTPTQQELHKVFTIEADTLSTYAWTNIEQCTTPLKAVALDIQGLNNGHAYKEEPERKDTMLGANGILVVRPYSGPWNWMSFETMEETDAVLDAVYDKYELDAGVPLIVFGRSMGGMGALNYARYGAREVAAVAVNCPVTNLAYHCTERPDCAATFYRAYNYYDVTPEEAVAQHDPMLFMEELPDIPYFFVAGDADEAVNKQVHSDVYVPMMREAGYNVSYLEVPGMAHVDLLGHPQALQQYIDFISAAGV